MPAAEVRGVVLEAGKIFDPVKEAETVGVRGMIPEEGGKALARHRLDDNCERQLSNAVNVAYSMSYTFHAMSSFFRRDDVALTGLGKFYIKRSTAEREDALDLSRYLLRRGGRVKLMGLCQPKMNYDEPSKGDALYAMELTVAMEKLQYEKYLALSKAAEEAKDMELQDYVCTKYLHPQVKLIKKHSEYVSQLRRVGKGQGTYLFDRVLKSKMK
ncbi:hypothetical protein CBR_g74638 [Chara braunii]|uniref:Ferritin n=1 Tax=Chara braunii TaxID=69332 RepID=A0A388KAA5_CHABU|nr:hypothetical protein CBR_g74638 [Chara braunii]|eukprot:GBG66951.1 hypothetical protein CBR_g74638 [Chara braunii]